MSQLTDQLIDIIAKPPAKRHASEIEGVLSWLRRRAPILRNLEKRELVEIVQECQYETATADDVVIQQGDHGDCMYIILRGTALVYIDTFLTGEEDVNTASPVASPTRDANSSPDARRKSKALERSRFGKYIMKCDAGKSFGEAALLGEDKSRNATVVAEEECDFMVVHQALFDKGLKKEQELAYAEVKRFVDEHPFFGHMSPKFKRLLELSLRKEIYPFDTVITRQGDQMTALYFLLDGEANLFVEPNTYQKQYPRLWPFEAGIDLYSQEFEWLRESRKNAILRKYEDPAVWPTKSEQLIVRRTEGYAAVEKMVQEKSVCLCSIRRGEVLGDIEIAQNLHTYMSTVICTATTPVFVLDVKNLERLVGKRNQVTMEVIKETAKEKLKMRVESHQGKEISFLSYLLYKFTEERLPSAKKLPPIKPTKQLPTKDIQVQHLLEKFKGGETPLIEPRVPGALIYKEQMQEKARIRANIRRRGTIGISAMLREARRKMNRRQPRSRREIVESLRQMMESDLVEYTEQAGSKDKTAADVLGQTQTNTRKSSIKSVTETPERRQSIGDASKNVRFQDSSRRGSKDDGRRNSVGDNRRGSRGEINSSVQDPAQANRKKGSVTTSTSDMATLKLPAIVESRETSSLTSAGNGSDVSDKGRRRKSGLDEKTIGEEVQGESSAKKEYQRKEVAASSSSPTRLPPLAKPELKKPQNVSPTKWNAALKFVNDRINDRFTEQLLNHGQGFDDYETSEVSLTVLENRIKSFFNQHIQPRSSLDKSDLKLPKLHRFKVNPEDAESVLPKPGGKVWIRKRLCRFANSKMKVKNHQHVRYHMVPELPQFENVQKARVIMHHIMAGAATGSSSSSPSKNVPNMSARNSISEGKIVT